VAATEIMSQLPAIIDRTKSIAGKRAHVVPALIATAGERASRRFLEFFAANIRNPHTRRAYSRAVADFLAWCEDNGVPAITAVQPLHVASWIELQQKTHAAPTVKLRLAAIRHLFDWLVTGQVVPVNPASSVRGPAHSVKEGKTPVLDPSEARALIDSIAVTTIMGLRDRALTSLMVYSFARVGAVLGMKVEDVYAQNRRLWVRLREKGGKGHAMPCHHNLESYLTAYIDSAGLAGDPKGPLFRTIGRGNHLHAGLRSRVSHVCGRSLRLRGGLVQKPSSSDPSPAWISHGGINRRVVKDSRTSRDASQGADRRPSDAS
jgi:site-specific recombinase XerC